MVVTAATFAEKERLRKFGMLSNRQKVRRHGLSQEALYDLGRPGMLIPVDCRGGACRSPMRSPTPPPTPAAAAVVHDAALAVAHPRPHHKYPARRTDSPRKDNIAKAILKHTAAGPRRSGRQRKLTPKA